MLLPCNYFACPYLPQIVLIVRLIMLFHSTKKPLELSVINLNARQDAVKKQLNGALKTNKKAKSKLCRLACCLKNKDSDKKGSNAVYVLDFVGDIKASAVEKLREEISAIISVAKAGDEVVVRLESSGGQVHSYGLAATQLARLKESGLSLTVCVDKVAASGGYMMACVADNILVAPFAIVGSIGVVSQMPNFYEFLKKHDINVEMFTAGEYKRTVTVFGENDDKDRAKYQEELERIHELFKAHIKKYRPSLDVEKVATGEFWLGSDAHNLGLADKLDTSDAYLLDKLESETVLMLQSKERPTLAQKLGLSEMVSDTLKSTWTWVQTSPFASAFDKIALKLP